MLCHEIELNFKELYGINPIVYQATCSTCLTLYHKKSDHIYRYDKDHFICVDCNSEIKAKVVTHPIHDGPFSLSGSGKCHQVTIPFCPKCEKSPNTHGTPITFEKNF